MIMKKKLLISACLIGKKVRFDAKVKFYDSKIINKFKKDYELIPFCPEVEGGLPTPRDPSEIQNGDGFDVISGCSKIINSKGKDVTQNFILGAKKALNVAKKEGIELAILKSKSPSCSNAYIYDGTFANKLRIGKGVTCALFEKEGIKVFSELDDES